jgi:hypothetical protein
MTKAEQAELLSKVIRLEKRLEQEQENALSLLQWCRRGWYMYDGRINDERSRLEKNIEIARSNMEYYQNALVELAAAKPKRNKT